MSAQPQLFGTDGIRGAADRYPLDRATVTALGRHLALTLAAKAAAGSPHGDPPLVVLGGDTRESTPRLCGWLAAGLAAAGGRFLYAGTVPTPVVAYLVRRQGAAAGIAVSASHNPHPDNGIKLFDAGGFKWAPEAEAALEERLRTDTQALEADSLAKLELEVAVEAVKAYLSFVRSTVSTASTSTASTSIGSTQRPLAGLKVALDTAQGAASAVAGPLFEGLGAGVEVLFNQPDGTNINHGCGSTHPEALARRVVAGGFDLGIAFDGDADRAMLVDETGRVRDGDAMLYLWALDLLAAGELGGSTGEAAIVATSMSNLGLERALAQRGIQVVRCGVGDRQVVQTLQQRGLVLGGEQSGHLVHLGLATTGDGLVTALAMAGLVAREGRPLSEMLAGFRRFPQVLINAQVARKPPLDQVEPVAVEARRVEEALGADGRLVLRYSGTEPLARVMIEGPDQPTIESMAQGLAETLRRELG